MNTILLVTDQVSKIKLNKDIKDVNNTVNKFNPIYTYECGTQQPGDIYSLRGQVEYLPKCQQNEVRHVL